MKTVISVAMPRVCNVPTVTTVIIIARLLTLSNRNTESIRSDLAVTRRRETSPTVVDMCVSYTSETLGVGY